MYEQVDKTLTAWFALALAGCLYPAQPPRRSALREESQQALRLLHLALAVGFITVAIPIRMDGHWITIGWLIEAGVLFGADRIHSELLNVFAIGALVLGIARLLIYDNFRAGHSSVQRTICTYLVAIAVLGAIVWYGGKRADDAARNAVYIASIAINVLALVALTNEVHDYFSRQMDVALQGNIFTPDPTPILVRSPSHATLPSPPSGWSMAPLSWPSDSGGVPPSSAGRHLS